MAIVAHTHPFVIGVDTHARNHALAILAAPTGEVIDDAQFPATPAGLARAVSWASTSPTPTPPRSALWARDCSLNGSRRPSSTP